MRTMQCTYAIPFAVFCSVAISIACCRPLVAQRPRTILGMGFTTEQCAKFEALYQKCTEVDNDFKIVQYVDEMLDLMIDSGEAQVKHISVSRVVPHKANRSGSFMEINKVYTKGSKVIGVGFSLARCDHKRAVAFQVKLGDDRDVKSFVDYANGSPHLATFDSTSVEGCSVGCGHLTQLLAAVAQECEVPAEFRNSPDLFGTHGGTKLDAHRLRKSNAQLSSTLDLGLKWTFIPYKFEQRYPKLPHVIQKALNTEHHIGEGETWDEQLRSIATAIVERCKAGKKLDYTQIAREVLSSKPPRASDVPAQVDFCKKWGGGASQHFVFDICTYLKLCERSARIVSAATFAALGRLKMPADSLCPHFVAAVVKCAATRGPAREGLSIHLTEADIKGIVKVLPAVREANTFIEKAREIEKELGWSHRIVDARGTMECDMVEYVMGKLSKADRANTSLNQISRMLCGASW